MKEEIEIYQQRIRDLQKHITFLNMQLLKATVKHRDKRASKLWWAMLIRNLKLKKLKDEHYDA